MIKHNQVGAVSGLGISLVLTVVLLLGALGFGGWAYTSRQDYKYNVDQKIAAATIVTTKKVSTAKDAEFVQKEKNPLRTYTGPEAYGSLSIQYPKTWSGAVDETATNSEGLVSGYFAPGVVPSLTSTASIFALRFQIVGKPYAEVLKSSVAPLQQQKEKSVTITPYALPKVPNVVGVQINGNMPNQKSGTMIVLPLRSQTLEIWTEGTQFTGDFNNIILPNLSFAP